MGRDLDQMSWMSSNDLSDALTCRLKGLMSVLQQLLQHHKTSTSAFQTSFTAEEQQDLDEFVHSWSRAFRTISIDHCDSSRAVFGVTLMCNMACLALRWMDIWLDHQKELSAMLSSLLLIVRTLVSIWKHTLLILVMRPNAIPQIQSKQDTLVEAAQILDFASYFLDCKY